MPYHFALLLVACLAVVGAGLLIVLDALNRRVVKLSRDLDRLWGQTLAMFHAQDERLTAQREYAQKVHDLAVRLAQREYS